MPAPPPNVLTFAASDPSGGAGLQADVLTLASLGCHPLSVVTALTLQDTHGVHALLPMQARWVAEQAGVLLDDVPVAAFKLGVLGSADNVAAVAGIVARHPRVPLILDPVLASGRGDPLADGDVLRAMRDLLLPLTTVLTPNSVEARRLASEGADSPVQGLADCARRLLAKGCEYVLITGTHEPTAQVINTLYRDSGVVREDRWERLAGDFHGSGCTLASAIAAKLAHGVNVPEAVGQAQRYTWNALDAGFRPGAGQSIPDRFFRFRNET